MSNQFLKLRRSSIPGKVPTTSSLEFGEIALNTYDGLAFIKKSGSNGEEIVTIGATSGNFSGSFTGSLLGTASWAQQALTSSYSLNINGQQHYVAVYDTSNSISTGTIYDSGSFTAVGTITPVDPQNPERFFVDAGNTNSYNLISGHGEIDNYLQLNVQNFSYGATGSSDLVATANNGTQNENYIDVGINNSGYNIQDGIGGGNDAYVYSTGNDLLIGNLSDGKKIVIFNGSGGALANARVIIFDQGTVGINAIDPSPTNPEALLVEPLPGSTNDFNNLIIGRATVNESYVQLNLINQGSGSYASADIVATNDIGTETDYYIDMGINSSNYSTPNAVGMANDAYLYSTGEHLHIGNASVGMPLMFFAGGLDAEANRKLELWPDNQHQMSGSLNITGSLTVLEGITGSLYGTASWALNTLTASFIQQAVSASYALTASYATSVSGTIANAVSASYAATASWAINAITASYVLNSVSSSFASTASYVTTAQTASFVTTAQTASYVQTAQTASYILNAVSSSFASTASFVALAQTASFVTLAQSASYVLQAVSSSFSSTASYVQNAVSSSFATNAATASSADNFVVRGSITGSDALFTGTITAQRLNVQYITSSTEFITGSTKFGTQLTDTHQFTGSVSITGSLSVDGTLNATSSWAQNAVTASYVQLAQSASYVSQAVSSSFASTASFVTLAQTASFVTLAQTASFVTLAQTASFVATAQTASFVATASWAENAVSSSYPIAVTGSTLYSVNPLAGPDLKPVNSIFLGDGSGFATIGGFQGAEYSNFLGYQAGYEAVDAAYSNFIGNLAGYSASNAYNSNFIGDSAGYLATNAYQSNFLGSGAGVNAINARNSNFFGEQSGRDATDALQSNFIGAYAGYTASLAEYSNFIGNEAGYEGIESSYSNFIGYRAGYKASNAWSSQFLGANTGQFAVNANESVFIGEKSGYSASLSNRATFLGVDAGNRAISASNSILIGYKVGSTQDGSTTIGRNNIILGTYITLPTGYQNGINIGGILFGSGSYFESPSPSVRQPFSGSANGRIGINQPDPQFSLDVSGSGRYTNGLQVTASLNAPSITGSLFGTSSWALNSLTSSFVATASWAQNAVTASYVTASNVFGPFGSNSIISSSYALTASYALNAGGAAASPTNQIATGSVTASVNVGTSSFKLTSASVQLLSISSSGLITGQRMFLSASQNTVSGSTLTVYGSGSSQPVFTVQGSQGELFSVNDSLSGSLFSVNDISGLPIIEAFSDNRVLIGSYQAPALITTVRTTSTIGNNVIYQNLPTASYDGAFFDYTVKSGSNARAGQITAIWSGSAVNYTETTTTDFGDTSGVRFMVMITGSNMALTGSFPSASWTMKTIVRSI